MEWGPIRVGAKKTVASSFTRATARLTLPLTLSARSLNRTAMRTETFSNALGALAVTRGWFTWRHSRPAHLLKALDALAVTRGWFTWRHSRPAHLLKALGALPVAEQDILPSVG